MEAKLIKNPEGYDTPYILTNMEDNLIASTEGKLSLKNCQVIELGYDLDELAEEGVKFHEQDEIHRPNSENLYKKGFQKALELVEHRLSKETEWQVEIVMEEPLVAKSRQIHGEFVSSKIIESAVFPKPKLDDDGCLILKIK